VRWQHRTLIGATAILLGSGGIGWALDTDGLVGEQPLAREVLARRHIRVDGAGNVPIDYRNAVTTFANEGLLDAVQAEYARQLPPGEEPEFVVHETAPGTFAYANAKGETSTLRELYRGTSGTNQFAVVYHVQGRRFFGDFQSLIHIEIAPAAATSTVYQASVYAYPESAVPRFFARHLGLVDRYFRSKTADIEALATRICIRLCAPPAGDGLAMGTPAAAILSR
jgi:hypothetical protein